VSKPAIFFAVDTHGVFGPLDMDKLLAFGYISKYSRTEINRMRVATVFELGQAIRGMRLDRGWTQTELARRVGTTQSWISEIERGKPTAEIGLVLRTLRVLQVHLEICTETEKRAKQVSKTSEAILKAAGLDGVDIDRIVDEYQ